MSEADEKGLDDALRKYLLGGLAEGERDRLEDLYFEDDGALERLLAAENDLIESYAAGRLTAEERERFRSNYLTTPERRRRVGVVERLRETAARESAAQGEGRRAAAPLWQRLLDAVFPRTPRARTAFALGLLLVVFGSLFLFNRTLTLRTRLGESERERAELSRRAGEARGELESERARAEELERRLEAERRAYDEQLAASEGGGGPAGVGGGRGVGLGSGPSAGDPVRPPAIPTLSLGFGGAGEAGGVGTASTGGRAARLEVPRESRFVRLRVRAPNVDAQNYTLTLRGADDAPRFTRTGLAARATRAGAALTVHVPAASLPPGRYTLVLTARRADGSTELAGEYPIEIENK